MSMFTRDHGLPSWADCIVAMVCGSIGFVVCTYYLFRKPLRHVAQ